MRAITSNATAPIFAEVALPEPGKEEVLVKVKAGALNRIDLMMMKGAAHGGVGGMGIPLGVEWAGEIVALGSAVDNWKVGDRVMSAGFGAFAEYTLGHARRMLPIPAGLSYEQAATLPVGLQTMHDAIATNGQLAPGQTVLIQGASSGMGLLGMQIAKCLGAGLVIGSSTSPERRAKLKDFGADAVIDSSAPDWVEQVKHATNGAGADLLVDLVAGPLVNGGMAALRVGGRMVNVGRVGGESGDFNFDLHSMRRITYIGVSFRTRTGAEVAEVRVRALAALGPALAEGSLRMPVDQVYRFDDAPAALERMAGNQHFGKIVLSLE
ncbi:MAG: zinc-binding dehydrogenase [Pseudomonadota bacterium]